MDKSAGDTLAGALQTLYRRNLHVTRLGLDAVQALLASMGQPQDRFLCVHIAGTNGKGSVAALMASILQACGLTTGLYTSPHLIRFHERIQVNGAPITDRELEALLLLTEAKAEEIQKAGHRDVTFFEYTTAMAFEHFRRSGVHVAVIETGMGGRLDATNVVLPALSVITPVAEDHAAYLGSTIKEIAGEKAGIIKEGRPVLVAPQKSDVMEVIRDTAGQRSAPLYLAEELVRVDVVSKHLGETRLSISTPDGDLGTVGVPVMGAHQVQNVGVAVAAAHLLRTDMALPIEDGDLVTGLERMNWPARGQVLSRRPPVILDGAHNPHAAKALASLMKDFSRGRPAGLVVGFLSDKDPVGFLQYFQSMVQRLWLCPVQSERAMPVEEIVHSLASHGFHPDVMALKPAVSEATHWAEEEGGVVCITGSLYLAGEVLELVNRQELAFLGH